MAVNCPPSDASPGLDGPPNLAASPHGARMTADAGGPGGPHWFAWIVANSQDVILSVDLHGVIVSWNHGAERLLGYAPAEALGARLDLICDTNEDQTPDTLLRPQAGDYLRPRQTTYRHKDGAKIDACVTASPVRNDAGELIGVAMIARDNTTQLRRRERQSLLLADMHHRIRNLFTLASSVVSLSSHFADSPADMARRVRSRLVALSRANDLTLSSFALSGESGRREVTLHALIKSIVASYSEPTAEGAAARVTISGVDVPISNGAVTHFALLLNELATNAVKYGALSRPAGVIAVDCSVEQAELHMLWREPGGPVVNGATVTEGFGSRFNQTVVTRQLGGSMTRDWTPEGIAVRLVVPLANLGQ
jgi:PAS domain S-box-containing protein